MLRVNQLTGFGVSGSAAVITRISGADGTNLGAPPAAWFDNVVTGSTSGTFSVRYGKDYASARPLIQARVIGSTTRGTSTNTGTGGFEWRGSNDGSSWTVIQTLTGVANVNVAGWVATITLSIPQSWRYTDVFITNSAEDSSCFVAEIEFYEFV
jgi:hypothetical protein